MNTLIISGGNISSDFALDFMKKQKIDFIIAVDRGMLFTWIHKIVPDLIVGDFDSVPREIIDRYRQENRVPIREYNPVKDATDTQIALEKAVEAGSRRIWILGGTGTRLDHVLGNLYAMQTALKSGVEVCMVDEHNCIFLLDTPRVLKRNEQYGKYVSFLPLGDRVSGVCLKGFKYPLENALLTNDNSLGVSNEIAEEEAQVSFDKGILIMIQSRD
ncbi:MAG: thiamine diphosphokinase [Ruminococcus sp.]